jgi:hypothetical protein
VDDPQARRFAKDLALMGRLARLYEPEAEVEEVVPMAEVDEPRPLPIKRDRRLRRLMVSEAFVLHEFVRRSQATPGWLACSRFDLPSGVELLAVHSDPYHACFNFLIRHESFPEVPEGEEIPAVNGAPNMVYEMFKLIPIGEGDGC